MFVRQPTLLHDCPLWAFCAGIIDGFTAMDINGDGARLAVSFGRGRAIHPYPSSRYCYIVGEGGDTVEIDGTELGVVALGTYAGHPVWRLGSESSATARYLFFSRNASQWIVFDELREPFAYAVTEIQNDGNEKTTAYGDSWHSGFPALGQTVSCPCAGKDALQASADGDEVPDPLEIKLDPYIWKSRSALDRPGFCGIYDPFNRATSTLRLGFWTYVKDGAKWLLDSSDRSKMFRPDGRSLDATPAGWLVRSDGEGAWYADLSAAKAESPLVARYSYFHPSAETRPAKSDIEMDWAGYSDMVSGVDYLYQAARLL